jgi:oxygen-dependent protoporphyrinogen oxidase
MKTVVVVGGGVSGLAAAEALAHRARGRGDALRVVVVEKDTKLGGKVGTRDVDGCVVELGPHGFLDKDPAVLTLIDRLGVRPRLLRANESAAERYVLRAGALRKIPSKPPAFLTSDILPLGAKLRVALEPFVPPRRDDVDESVFEFAARRIGAGAADVLVDAMVTGIYGGDPHRLSLRAAFPVMHELEARYGGLLKAQLAKAREKKQLAAQAGVAPEAEGAVGAPRGTLHSFDRGLTVLVDALARDREVRLGVGVAAIARRADDGFDLRLDDGATLAADAVYLTTPTPVMAGLVRPLGGPAAQVADALDGVRYASIAVVVHVFDGADVPRRYDGFGFLAPDRERCPVLGCIWASTVFAGHTPDGRVMLRTLLGGVRRPENAEGTDAELSERVRGALERLLGVPRSARARHEVVVRWPAAIPQYEVGHGARVAAADQLEAAVPGLVLGGNGLRGVAMVQCLLEGERAAARIEAALARRSA